MMTIEIVANGETLSLKPEDRVRVTEYPGGSSAELEAGEVAEVLLLSRRPESCMGRKNNGKD